MRNSEMSRACSMFRGEEICVQGLMRKRDRRRPLGGESVDGMITLKWTLN
jgi:hypothetical protein